MNRFDAQPPVPEDEYAPLDYSCVSSVSEGRRLEQQQKIHRELKPSGPIVRHRAEPENSAPDIPSYLSRPSREPRSTATQRDTVMRRLPTLEDEITVQSVAYPEDYGIPDDPFHPPAESQQPSRRRAQRAPEPEAPPVTAAAEEPQSEPAAAPEIPDWLRVAQQNNLPLNRPQTPRVQTAPRREEDQPVQTDVLGRPLRRRTQSVQQASPYEQAGYPEELLEMQRRMEAEQAAQPIRRRHGAQYAVKPQAQENARPQPAAAPQTSYPPPRQAAPVYAPPASIAPPERMQRAWHEPAPMEPDDGWRVEDDEEYERELPEWIKKVPWLGIGAFIAVLAAVIVWIMGMNYEKQTAFLLEARAAQERSIVERHPLKYEELIAEKAQKYNLSPAFVAAIMLNESSFRPDATSSVDARGLMQLMDDTASWIYDKMDLTTGYDFDNLYDAETNVEYGCWYLNFLSERFRGDPVLVAAAFHAGQGEVQNWLNDSRYSKDGLTIRLEDMIDGPTKKYVGRVLDAFAAYKRLYYGG